MPRNVISIGSCITVDNAARAPATRRSKRAPSAPIETRDAVGAGSATQTLPAEQWSLARPAQCHRNMAAILALIFVPALAAILFMMGIAVHSHSLATGAAAVIFVSLAMGVFGGLMKLMRTWEAGDEHEA